MMQMPSRLVLHSAGRDCELSKLRTPGCSICLTAKCRPSFDPLVHQYRLPELSQPSFSLPPVFLDTASGQSYARQHRGFCFPGSSFTAQASSCCSFPRGGSGEFSSPPASVPLFLSSPLDNQYETRMLLLVARG
jgi:hypothetical protein